MEDRAGGKGHTSKERELVSQQTPPVAVTGVKLPRDLCSTSPFRISGVCWQAEQRGQTEQGMSLCAAVGTAGSG